MKKAIKAASFLVALTSAMSVSAAPPDFEGSDTLEELVRDLVTSNCRGATNANLSGLLNYKGGGSGTAANAMIAELSGTAGAQQISGPMSRALTTTATTGECARAETAAPGSAATAKGLVVGLDGIVVVGSTADTAACGGGHSTGTGTPGTSTYRQAGPNYAQLATEGDSIAGAAPAYVFAPTTGAAAGTGWRDVLRLLYTGLTHDQTNPSAIPLTSLANCSSPARTSLSNSYPSLFHGGCTAGTCTQIKHAYRRGDLSGTTDSFLSLIGAPAVTRSATGAVTGTPFCNGFEADDKDPIRRKCTQDEQVCEADGTLGLVLPLVVSTFSNNTAEIYNASGVRSVGSASNDVAVFQNFRVVTGTSCVSAPASDSADPTGSLPLATSTTALGWNLPAGARFPNTPRCDCRFPTPDSYSGIIGGAAAAKNEQFAWNRRSGGCLTPSNPEGRVGLLNGDEPSGNDNSPGFWGARYNNTPAEVAKNRCCSAPSPTGPNTRFVMDPRVMNLQLRNPTTGAFLQTAPAYYRIKSNTKGRTVLPNRTSGAYTNGTVLCQDQDATRLIGCLTQQPSTCSVGAAGREASESVLANAINAEPFAVKLINPTVPNIQNGTYPLSRKLYFNTFAGFGTNPAGSATSYETALFNLYKCLASPRSQPALAAAGFVDLIGGPQICENMCTTNNSCAALSAVPAADLLPPFTP